MNRCLIALALLVLATSPLRAQDDQPPPKVYYGGSVGLSVGSYFRINVSPTVGFRLSPKVDAGLKASYEYTKDTRSSQEVTSSNFGGSVFARYHIIPQAYLHSEFSYMSYKHVSGGTSGDREWVPFLLVGAGVVQPLGAHASAYAEVLVDVLQNAKSPYEKWTPIINVGVAVGL